MWPIRSVRGFASANLCGRSVQSPSIPQITCAHGGGSDPSHSQRPSPGTSSSLAIVVVVARIGSRLARQEINQPAPSTQARIVWLDQPGPRRWRRQCGGNRAKRRRGRRRHVDTIRVGAGSAAARDRASASLMQNEPEPVRQVVIPARSLAGCSSTALPGAIEERGIAVDVCPRGTRRRRRLRLGYAGPATGPTSESGLGPDAITGTGGGVYRIGNGVTLAGGASGARRPDTTAAMRARVQGAVIVEMRRVDERRLHRCARGPLARFHVRAGSGSRERGGTVAVPPGHQAKEPAVPVLVTMEITFTLRW